MAERILIKEYDWSTQQSEPMTVDGQVVQEFVDWLMRTSVWKMDPELLTERCMKLRKKLAEDVRPASRLEVRGNVKLGPNGKFVSTKK